MSKQKAAPIYEALAEYLTQRNVSFHVPGHKNGRGIPDCLKNLPGPGIFRYDLTEVPGLDDLHQPTGPIKKAQDLAAELFRADFSFLLVNGTTCGLQAAVMALCGDKDPVLVPRHAHRAVAGALVLSGAMPVYIKPAVDKDYGVPVKVAPDDVARAIKKMPGMKATLQVHPTYHGFAADLRAVTQICHDRGIPVITDEAHGAHFAFHPDLPAAAMDSGADISVQSTHKTLGALTQGSMLHLKGNLVNRDNIVHNLQLLQTTSPSYLVMVSLDLARRQMAEEGKAMLDRVLEMARWTRGRVATIEGIKCFGPENLVVNGFCDGMPMLDPTKILINVTGLGLTGYEAAAVLREEHHIQVELADPLNILLVLTIGTTWDDCRALVEALVKMAVKYRSAPGGRTVNDFALFSDQAIPPVAMTPREAWFAPARTVRLEEARDCVAAETVAPYPPGIPVVCAGERITEDVVELLKYVRDNEIPCQGLADFTKRMIKVIRG